MYSAAVVTNTNANDMVYWKYLNAMQKLINVRFYLNIYSALTEITKNRCELIIIDADIPDCQAFELAAKLLKHKPNLMLVLVVDNDDYALEAMQIGALDYIVRPISWGMFEKLLDKLERKRSRIRDGP